MMRVRAPSRWALFWLLLAGLTLEAAIFLQAKPQSVTTSPSGGPRGSTGPAPNLSVGTVTKLGPGSSPTVTVTGTNPNYSLNMGLVTGDTGAPGSNGTNATNPNFTFPTPTKIAAGGNPTVTVTGTYPNLVVTYGIVTGNTGANGTNATNPNFTTSASSLTFGSSPTAVLSGTYPNLNVAFGIPAGQPASNAISYPNSRTVALATAYQCTDTTKPCFVQALVSCTLSVALLSPGTNTVELRVGNSNSVATGGGTQVDINSSSLTVSIVLTLGWTGQAGLKGYIPTGGFFALRQTVGTGCTITGASDQSLG